MTFANTERALYAVILARASLPGRSRVITPEPSASRSHMPAPKRLPLVCLLALITACAGPAAPVASPTPPTASPMPTFQATAATVQPTATASVSSPVPTTEPTLEPERTPEPIDGGWAQNPPTPLLMNAAVRVRISELNVRELPSTSARRVGTLTPENILVVRSLPFEADGYIWYSGVVVSATGELPPLPHHLLGVGDAISGWFAATKGSIAYVARVEPRCPAVVDLRNVAAMLPAERLDCFGDRPIELEGTFGCAGCSVEISGKYEPSWLTYPAPDLLWEQPMEDPEPIRLRFRPSGPDLPAQGSIIRVRGHFGDDAALQCSLATFYPWDRFADDPPLHEVAAVVARRLCRQEFVVDSYEVTGTDPDFPSS